MISPPRRSSRRALHARTAGRALLLALGFLAAPLANAQDKKPTDEEIPVPALGGWQGTLVVESDSGIWTNGTLKAFAQYGCPEVFGLDDKGRCIVCWSYSGKWTPVQTTEDKEWLGALVQLDLDPHRPGEEIYTGGKRGNLYQIQFHREGQTDVNLIAKFPALEIHTLVAGDLVPSRPGNELLLFTLNGETFEVAPKGDGKFETRLVASLSGRVRQALLLPSRPGETPWIAAVMRSGEVALMRWSAEGLEVKNVLHEPMGFGRCALKPGAVAGGPFVLYVTRDDGVILRLSGRPEDSSWTREMIFAGPQGPRGIAAGRFDADPAVETVAVFGYSTRVELLSRRPGQPWTSEVIFQDRDKGHWLSVAELDGRNSTDELLASGYGKRLVLLSRPPGYGVSQGPAVTAPKLPPTTTASAEPRPVRVAIGASKITAEDLSPLRYHGGFETKTSMFETLVRKDDRGVIVPSLAQSWAIEDGGKTFRMRLRGGARFHDGTAVTGAAVALHLKRSAGFPEHAWLRGIASIESVTAPSSDEVVITLDRPYPLLEDLCAINPCAIQSPTAFDGEGDYRMPIGTGPFAFSGLSPEGNLLLAPKDPATTAGRGLEIVPFARGGPDPLVALEKGEVDVVVDGDRELIARERVKECAADPRYRLAESAGSAVMYLSFRMDGATADAGLRRAVAAAVDRAALVREVECGHGDPCETFAAPNDTTWPAAKPAPNAGKAPSIAKPLVALALATDTRAVGILTALAASLASAGIPVELVRADAGDHQSRLSKGEWDLRVERTWGRPYDPFLSLMSRFGQPTVEDSATGAPRTMADPGLARLVEDAARTARPEELSAAYAKIQSHIDREASVVPLYSPRRLALARADAPMPVIGTDLYRMDWTARSN